MQELEKILEEIVSEFDRRINTQLKIMAGLGDDVYRYGHGKSLEAYQQGKLLVIEIISKHMTDGWIPVNKDHIPEGEILACDIYENELIGYLSYDTDSESFICEDDGCIMEQVIAWMKKPDPYRPERSGTP